MDHGWQERLDTAMWHFADLGMFSVDAAGMVSISEFGRDCVVILTKVIDEDVFEF